MTQETFPGVVILLFIVVYAAQYWIRALRLYLIAKKYNLSYRIGDLLKLTFNSQITYKRNVIVGEINGNKIELFDWYRYCVTPWGRDGSIFRVNDVNIRDKVGLVFRRKLRARLWLSEIKKEFIKLASN